MSSAAGYPRQYCGVSNVAISLASLLRRGKELRSCPTLLRRLVLIAEIDPPNQRVPTRSWRQGRNRLSHNVIKFARTFHDN